MTAFIKDTGSKELLDEPRIPNNQHPEQWLAQKEKDSALEHLNFVSGFRVRRQQPSIETPPIAPPFGVGYPYPRHLGSQKQRFVFSCHHHKRPPNVAAYNCQPEASASATQNQSITISVSGIVWQSHCRPSSSVCNDHPSSIRPW